MESSPASGPLALQHASLASTASDWIAARILDGSIKPGERITEEGLAQQMGVSRSPVREALRALSRDGFVVVEPRRGARVSGLDRREAEELYACRLLMEPECDASTVAALTPDRARHLEELFAQMATAADSRDTSAYLAASKEYNGTLLDGCPNRTLSGFAESAWRRCLRYWDLVARAVPEHLSQSVELNERLQSAVRARDADAARAASAAALRSGRDELLAVLDRLAATGGERG